MAELHLLKDADGEWAYPSLGRDCPCPTNVLKQCEFCASSRGFTASENHRNAGSNCERCAGLNRIPVHTTDALLEVARQLAMNARIELSGSQNGPNHWTCTIWTRPRGKKVRGDGIPEDALEAALLAAVREEA